MVIRKYRTLLFYTIPVSISLFLLVILYHISVNNNGENNLQIFDGHNKLFGSKDNELNIDNDLIDNQNDEKDKNINENENSFNDLLSVESDQYDQQEVVEKFLDKNQENDDKIKNIISKMTNEEIREQLKIIKSKQEEKERSRKDELKKSNDKINDSNDNVHDTLINNPNRMRSDSPPDNFPWAKYEIERKIPNDYDINIERQNATLFTLCRNSELFDILNSIQQLENRFNENFHYDWVFLNDEPFSKEFIELTSNMVSGRARYGLIPKKHWSYPEFIDQTKAKEIRESKKWSVISYGSSESYRHMCRFNSLFFYKHPIIEEYQYYWRVEPHVNFGCDIIDDPFKFLNDNNKKYGFTISMKELPNTIETLWETSKLYFEEIKEKFNYKNDDNLIKFVTDDEANSYNLCHYWSNFEIANLDIYRNELYEGYVEFLDKAGGFFYERWGDAPVHSIIFSILLKKEELHLFQDISYEHTVAQSCPLNDAFLKKARCTCDPNNDFAINSDSSCNLKFLEVSGQTKNDDFDKYVTSLQKQREEEWKLRDEQRKLRMETARRQSKARRKKAEERRKNRLAVHQARKEKEQNNNNN